MTTLANTIPVLLPRCTKVAQNESKIRQFPRQHWFPNHKRDGKPQHANSFVDGLIFTTRSASESKVLVLSLCLATIIQECKATFQEEGEGRKDSGNPFRLIPVRPWGHYRDLTDIIG